MKKGLVFFNLGISGGTATLAFRISQEFIRQGYDTYYVLREKNDDNNIRLFQDNNIMIELQNVSNWGQVTKKFISEFDELVIFCFHYFHFARINKLTNQNTSKKVKTFLYVVQDRCLISGDGENNSLLIGIRNRLHVPYVKYMIRNNSLIFMDENTIETTEKGLGINLREMNVQLLRLPYKPKSGDYIKTIGDRKNVVITAARFDFPFKAYIVGLVKSMEKIMKKNNVELWIVGDGEGRSEINNAIESIDYCLRKRIKLLGNVEYDKLIDLISETKLFVGMGTGLLDASSVYVPSIGIQEFQYGCMGKGLFSDNPTKLGYGIFEKGLHDITSDIEKVIQSDDDKYREMCLNAYNVLVSEYAIEGFVSSIISTEVNYKLPNLFEITTLIMDYLLTKNRAKDKKAI